jgi:hypothetical protein
MTTIVVACVFSAGGWGVVAFRRACGRGLIVVVVSVSVPLLTSDDRISRTRTSTIGERESQGGHIMRQESAGKPRFGRSLTRPRIENDNEHEHEHEDDWGMGESWGAHHTAGKRGETPVRAESHPTANRER